MILGDFHLHSRFSDGILSISELVDLFGRNGFGAIAITDHLCEQSTLMGKGARVMGRTLTESSFPNYLETIRSEAARAWDQYQMLVIPGVELTKNSLNDQNSAHILALGVTEYISADGEIEDIVAKIKAQGALAIAAHPVDTRKKERQTHLLWSRRQELFPLFDAWEVASGPHWFDEVAATDLPKIASSDFHGPLQFTSWKTVLRCEPTLSAVLQAIKKQEIEFKFFTAPNEEVVSLKKRVEKQKRSTSEKLFDLSLSIF